MLKAPLYALYSILFIGLAPFICHGQYTAPPAGLNFNGTGLSETTTFTIGARWTAHWDSFMGDVTIEDSNGLVITGVSTAGPGSIFVPAAGTYKLHIAPIAPGSPWNIHVGQVSSVVATTGVGNYTPPDNNQPSATRSGNFVPPPPGSAPGFAGTPPPAPTPPLVASGPDARMTTLQAAAVVLIRGDKGEGTGFLVKMPTGPVVITNQHVIAANPHLKITTVSGSEVKIMGLQGASDRDLAIIPIQDNNYSYLELATDIGSTVQVNDDVITPGNSEGGGVMLNTSGRVLGIGPEKVEISNPVFHGNSGGPIFHVKSGKVIGVVTEGLKVDSDDALDAASLRSANSAITSTIRYFGLRLDNVPLWQPYTWARFNNETEFLYEFEERSKCLDSYLNTSQNDTSDWGLYYMNDDKIKDFNQSLGTTMGGDDATERIQSAKDFIFTLSGLAETNMDEIQQPTNFYSFDQMRTKNEIAYRTALQKEIDQMRDNVDRIGGLARRTN